jgi:hypothetical protein
MAGATVPVTVKPGVRPMLTSRWDDSSPWWGGGTWIDSNTSRRCSTGFAVNYGGGPKMLTAGHCADPGATASDPTGEVIGKISNSDIHRDVLVIDAPSAGRVFNNTPGSPPPSEFSNPVIGTMDSFVGMRICSSGASSGTDCGIQVTAINAEFNGDYPIDGLVEAEQTAHTNAIGEHDSGGPVEVTSSADNTKVYVLGTNTGIDSDAYAPCTGYDASPDRICAWRMFYAPWSNATTAFPGISVITG